MEDKETIVSLHRPYHSNLWVVRWVCEFMMMKNSSSKRRTDFVCDFYFFFVERLNEMYSKVDDPNTYYISRSAISDVISFFKDESIDKKRVILLNVLRRVRLTRIEKHVYSTYKAATYAINLADDKLHFIKKYKVQEFAKELHLQRRPSTNLNLQEKKVFFRQILRRDLNFFVPFCMLHSVCEKYKLDIGNVAFDFSRRYYPVSRFNYTHCSHDNYTKVREQWIVQLGVLKKNGSFSLYAREILEDDEFINRYETLRRNTLEFIKTIKGGKDNNKQIRLHSAYLKLVTRTDGTGYVNLYDIMKEIGMSYKTFNILLQNYYNDRRRSESIFLLNVVVTADQRKRFYINGKPVIKIRIVK